MCHSEIPVHIRQIVKWRPFCYLGFVCFDFLVVLNRLLSQEARDRDCNLKYAHDYNSYPGVLKLPEST